MSLTKYKVQLGQLVKAIAPETFKLVFIQHNYYPLAEEIKTYLEKKFPERKTVSVNGTEIDYHALMGTITGLGAGIVFIDDFDLLLDNEKVYPGLNQRRDKLSKYPITLICFMLQGNEGIRKCMDHIPDLWSFRELVQEYEAHIPKKKKETVPFLENSNFSSIGGNTIHEKRKSLEEIKLQLNLLGDTPQEKEQRINLLRQIGRIYFDLNENKKNKDIYEEILMYDIQTLRKDHPSIGVDQSFLGLIYKELGNFSKAKELLEKALKSGIKNFGENHPEVAINRSNLGMVYENLGDLTKARELSEKAYESDLKNFDENHPDVALHGSNLAVIYSKLGDFTKAKELLEKALENDIKNLGKKHPNVAVRQSNLAGVFRGLGNLTKAKELLEEALENSLINYGENNLITSKRYNNLAAIYCDLGDLKQSNSAFKKAYSIRIHILGSDHPDTKRTKVNLEDVKQKLSTKTSK